MLTCKEFLNELTDYLDDRCDQGLKAQLHQHVSECPNCWVVVDTTKKTIQVYKGMEPQDIPCDVKGRLMAALNKKLAAKNQA